MSDELKSQINEIIKLEVQQGINAYLDQKDKDKEDSSSSGFGFVPEEEADKLNVTISNEEVEKIIKEYKKLKKNKKSNFGQIKKLGLVDKHGKPLT